MSKHNKYELSDVDIETAIAALNHCSPFDRDEWVQMGMAIKSEFGEDAFSGWDLWSQQDKHSYKAASALSVWKSFKKSGICIGTMLDRAIKNGFKFENQQLSKVDRKRLESERKTRLDKRKKEEEEAEEKNNAWRKKLSDFLTSTMQHFDIEGASDYLKKKHVAEFGLLFSQQPMVMAVDQERDILELYFGHERFTEFFKIHKDERPKFRQFKKGIFAVPLVDIEGRLWNLQIIQGSGHKSFYPGRKQGCFHLIGSIPAVGRFNLCLAEGYANAACVHMALKCPVIVALDSGNLRPVAEAFAGKYANRINQFAVCADDDQHLVEQGQKNVGLRKAEEAAKIFDGIVITPVIDQPFAAAKPDDRDILYYEAATFVIDSQKVSMSGLRTAMNIGYNHAARIIQQLESAGVVSEISPGGKRKVLKPKPQRDNANDK